MQAQEDERNVLRVVTALTQNQSFFSPAVRQLADRGITDRYDTLSEREREAFQLIGPRGRSTRNSPRFSI